MPCSLPVCGLQNSTVLLVLAATACGVFTGLRGGVFTIVGARVNRRIRQMLFNALLNQEIGKAAT